MTAGDHRHVLTVAQTPNSAVTRTPEQTVAWALTHAAKIKQLDFYTRRIDELTQHSQRLRAELMASLKETK